MGKSCEYLAFFPFLPSLHQGKRNVKGLEIRLSSKEHVVLFQRTRVQSPEPTLGELQPPVTLARQNLTLFFPPQAPTFTCVPKFKKIRTTLKKNRNEISKARYSGIGL